MDRKGMPLLLSMVRATLEVEAWLGKAGGCAGGGGKKGGVLIWKVVGGRRGGWVEMVEVWGMDCWAASCLRRFFRW